MLITRQAVTDIAVGLLGANVRFTHRKCKNIVKKVANGADLYAKITAV